MVTIISGGDFPAIGVGAAAQPGPVAKGGALGLGGAVSQFDEPSAIGDALRAARQGVIPDRVRDERVVERD